MVYAPEGRGRLIWKIRREEEKEVIRWERERWRLSEREYKKKIERDIKCGELVGKAWLLCVKQRGNKEYEIESNEGNQRVRGKKKYENIYPIFLIYLHCLHKVDILTT